MYTLSADCQPDNARRKWYYQVVMLCVWDGWLASMERVSLYLVGVAER